MKPASDYYHEIFSAIRRDDRKTVQSILTQYPESVEWTEKGMNRTGLIVAASENKPEIVHLFMEHGANQFAQEWAGGSALRIAVYHGEDYLEVVRALLQYPQDLNNLDAHGGILPLWKAMQNENNQSMIELLVKAGANPSVPGRENDHEPIYKTVQREESPEMNQCILQAKVRWDAENLGQTTPAVSRRKRRATL